LSLLLTNGAVYDGGAVGWQQYFFVKVVCRIVLFE